jgi:hypothetical protein
VAVSNIAPLEDPTVLVEFTTTTSQAGASGKSDVKSYALTLRYQIVAPTADAALTANPFGIVSPFFRLERTAGPDQHDLQTSAAGARPSFSAGGDGNADDYGEGQKADRQRFVHRRDDSGSPDEAGQPVQQRFGSAHDAGRRPHRRLSLQPRPDFPGAHSAVKAHDHRARAGEKLIANPAMGDSIQWEVDDDKMNHVFIKPHKADIVNRLHLTTNRREYDFTLIALPAGGFFCQTVRFQSLRAPMARMNARDEGSGAGTGATGGERGGDSGAISVAPDTLSWDCSVDDSAEFKPDVVFDDGHSIWMRMHANAKTWPVPTYKGLRRLRRR